MLALSLNEAWDIISNEATLCESNHASHDEIKVSLDVIKSSEFMPIFLDWYIEKFRLHLNKEIIPSFWNSLSEVELISAKSIKSSTITFRFVNTIDQLYEDSRRWIKNPLISLCFDDNAADTEVFEQKLSLLLKSKLLSDVPLHFNDYVFNCYTNCFRISRSLRKRHGSENNTSSTTLRESDDSFLADESGYSFGSNEQGCPVCGKTEILFPNEDMLQEDLEQNFESDLKQQNELLTENINCNCGEIIEAFEKMNHHLKTMKLQEEVANDAVISIIHSHIESQIRNKCRSNFDTSFLERLENWVKNNVLEWLTSIYKAEEKFLAESENRLLHVMYEAYGSIRIEQLFEIIVEFPDSVPAIHDLKRCLEKCHGFRSRVISTLKSSFEARLLHPGVATNDILTAYISAIKALRLLDSTGVILQLVCDPIRNYLKSKDDTVRCIITALTDEHSELIPELVREQPADANQSDDENIVKNWQSWKPDPIEAAQAPKNSKAMRSSDIVSILVNVYETKDKFVEVYQKLLSERFLSNFDCNVDFERRNLELLTLKFGESDLNSCDVMLHDMTSSKRLDKRINSGEIAGHHPAFTTNCLILSAEFWPKKFGLPNIDEASGLQLPEHVTQAQANYTKAFETIKGSRTLQWKPHLGLVEVELEFKERLVTFNVTPIQACIIVHFQEKASWKISELAQVLGVPPSVVRRKILFWQNKGILREDDSESDQYVLVEDEIAQSQSASDNQAMNVEDEEEEDYDAEDAHNVAGGCSGGAAKSTPVDEKFRVFWSFIENMLTNLNSLPLERIHTMLHMFALPGADNNQLTIQELRQFLDLKVREQKLVYSGGQYSLPSSQ